MPDLVLHPVTQAAITQYLHQPSHAVLLTGAIGSGKSTIARHIAVSLLDVPDAKFDNHPYVRRVQPVEGKAIPIEAVRAMQQFVSLKVPQAGTTARCILIEDSQLMTTEAQNALLKTLEEPPQDTVLILTATSQEGLLPTIRSRVQVLSTVPPAIKALQAHFAAAGYDQQAVDQAVMVSGGLPGLMHSILTAENHQLHEATAEARKLLQMSMYERLAAVDKLSKQKQLTLDMLFILGQMARTALVRNPSMAPKACERWKIILEQSYDAIEALRHNAQPKLVLTSLMLSI